LTKGKIIPKPVKFYFIDSLSYGLTKARMGEIYYEYIIPMKRAMRGTLSQEHDYPWRVPSDN